METSLLEMELNSLCRVIQQVLDLSWVDFDLNVQIILPSCFAQSAHLSRELWADSGTAKIKST